MGHCDGIQGWSVFIGRRFNIIFQEKVKQFGTSYVIAVNRYFSEARTTAGLGDGTRLWKLRAVNGWQGTPRSDELGGKYDLKSRGSAFSCAPNHEQQETRNQLPKHLQMGHCAGFKGGGIFA